MASGTVSGPVSLLLILSLMYDQETWWRLVQSAADLSRKYNYCRSAATLTIMMQCEADGFRMSFGEYAHENEID